MTTNLIMGPSALQEYFISTVWYKINFGGILSVCLLTLLKLSIEFTMTASNFRHQSIPKIPADRMASMK